MGLLNSLFDIASSAFSSIEGGTTKDKVTEAYRHNWISPAGFIITELKRPYVTSPSSKGEYNSNASKYSFTSDTNWKNILNMHLQKAALSSLESTPIEFWNGGVWSYTTGRPVTRQLTLTFTDSHNGETDNSLYKKFLANYWYLHNLYPSEQHWTIEINNKLDFQSHELNTLGKTDVKGSPFVSTKMAVLHSIGELRYSQSNTSFMTFDVSFKFYEAM